MPEERIESLAQGLAVLDVLFGHAAHGLATMEVARAVKRSPSATTRALYTLEQCGYAERLPETGRWRASVLAVRKIQTFKQALDTAKARLQETQARLDAQL